MNQTCRPQLPPVVHKAINFAKSSITKKGEFGQPALFYQTEENGEIQVLPVGAFYDSTTEGRNRLRDILQNSNASCYALAYEAYWVTLDNLPTTPIDVSAPRGSLYKELGFGSSLATHPYRQEAVFISYQKRGEPACAWYSFLSRKAKVRLGHFIRGLDGMSTGLTVALFDTQQLNKGGVDE